MTSNTLEIIEPKEILGIINVDHPGANDPAYRARRDFITNLAKDFRKNPRVLPTIKYTDQEHHTWEVVVRELDKLHSERACSLYLDVKPKIKIPKNHIPQMADLSREIEKFNGMRLAPVEGLVDSRSFLSQLGKKVMLCTQYIRHHSRPTYTPEPDIIHEFMGHVPTFGNKDLVEFSAMIGSAAARATPEQITQLERLYWFTLEFGLIREDNSIKAFGAGLLAGIEDMQSAFSPTADVREFNVDDVLQTDYNYSHIQPIYFVIPSFAFLRRETRKLLDTF